MKRERTWLVTVYATVHDLADRLDGTGRPAPIKVEVMSRAVTAADRPQYMVHVTTQTDEIAYIQPKKARGKKRGKRG